MTTTKETLFKDDLRLILDMVQLLKYNLADFKKNGVHDTVPKDRNMRPDITALFGALNTFLMSVQRKCDADTFRGLLNEMGRDKLHDLSVHMQFMYQIDNVNDITELLQTELKIQEKGILRRYCRIIRNKVENG